MKLVTLMKNLMQLEGSFVIVTNNVVLVIQDLHINKMESIFDSLIVHCHVYKRKVVLVMQDTMDLGLVVLIPTTTEKHQDQVIDSGYYFTE